MTSAQIARQAGLNERYVREWAATMAAQAIWTTKPPTPVLDQFRAGDGANS